MMTRKIALFGGTFDPVHLGHTAVAADAAKQIDAEKVVFVPAKRSPLKGYTPNANDEHRIAMIAFAIEGNAKFDVSDLEMRRPAPSYTIDTVRQFKIDYGSEATIYWLIGADAVNDLQHWHAIEELIDLCCLCTMYRAGCEPPDFAKFEAAWGRRRVQKLRRSVIQTPLVNISSTEVRNRLADGADVTGMLAPAVENYIRRHNLYVSHTQS